MDCGWQIVTNLQSVQVRTNYYYLTALAGYFNSIQMPQAKTPKPVSLAVPWAMPDPVIPLHSCQPAPDLQAHKISVAVMFLTCQIADAASCLRKITNRINLWMPSHASRPSLKKMARKSKPCSSVPTLLRATCCYNTSSKVWIRTSQIMSPKHYLEQ